MAKSKDINWSDISRERMRQERRAELKKPISARYKRKAVNHMIQDSVGSTLTLRSLGDGGFEKTPINIDHYGT